jgi:hypothetical protein
MKRFIYHVPVKQILVCAIEANTEAEARAEIDAGVCEHHATLPGTTASGQPELVDTQEIKEND